jgi:hypothetical protein
MSEEELRKEFMLEYQYKTHFDKWPHTTILLCQFSIETMRPGEFKAITNWIRFNINPTSKKHAEEEMIRYVRRCNELFFLKKLMMKDLCVVTIT